MAIFGREIILFSAKGRESQRSLRVCEQEKGADRNSKGSQEQRTWA